MHDLTLFLILAAIFLLLIVFLSTAKNMRSLVFILGRFPGRLRSWARPADPLYPAIAARGSPSDLGPQFNDFLFAPVDDEDRGDKGGGLLSLLSLLARQDIDPWKEAANLSSLPKRAAIERLAAIIQKVPGRATEPAAATLTATRLITLLPHAGRPAGVPLKGASRRAVKVPSWLIYILAMMLIAQFGVQLLRPAPPAVPHPTTSAASPNPGR